VFKGRHFDRSVILLCVHWSLAYGLSLRTVKETMAATWLEPLLRWVKTLWPLSREAAQCDPVSGCGRPVLLWLALAPSPGRIALPSSGYGY